MNSEKREARIEKRLFGLVPFVALVLALSCRKAAEPDAYGNFEATEVVVSSETAGQLLSFAAVEGQPLTAGAVVAIVDTVQLTLERAQVQAQRAATGARAEEVTRQIAVLEVQHDIARRAYERTKRLFDEKAATAQQLDQAERDDRVLVAQIAAARAQRQSVTRDESAAQARVAQISDRAVRSSVRNPVGGTVLATYTRRGEMVQAGQPLYRIASLDTLTLRAYVSESQLASLRLGARVTVNVDRGAGDRLALLGTVSWIASKAEFTPTPVQTRDERADLVYAIKVLVANPGGVLKIGMPADLALGATAAPNEKRS